MVQRVAGRGLYAAPEGDHTHLQHLLGLWKKKKEFPLSTRHGHQIARTSQSDLPP